MLYILNFHNVICQIYFNLKKPIVWISSQFLVQYDIILVAWNQSWWVVFFFFLPWKLANTTNYGFLSSSSGEPVVKQKPGPHCTKQGKWINNTILGRGFYNTWWSGKGFLRGWPCRDLGDMRNEAMSRSWERAFKAEEIASIGSLVQGWILFISRRKCG